MKHHYSIQKLREINKFLKELTSKTIALENKLMRIAGLVYAMDKRVKETRDRLIFLSKPEREHSDKYPDCLGAVLNKRGVL